MATLNPAERSQVGRIGAHISWANTENPSARTAPARAAMEAKFLAEADGDPVRAEHLRKAHYARLALKSAQAQRFGPLPSDVVALTDQALAVRGGSLRDPVRVRGKVLESVRQGFGPVLSVWCADALADETRDKTLLRLCSPGAGDFPHPKVQVGTVGAVRSVVRLVQWSIDGEPESHYHAIFDDDVPSSQVEAFVLALGEPEPNPTGGKP